MGLGDPAGDREPGTLLGARFCLEEHFYLHRRGIHQGLLPDHIRHCAWPEFGSDAASRGYLGPIN